MRCKKGHSRHIVVFVRFIQELPMVGANEGSQCLVTSPVSMLE